MNELVKKVGLIDIDVTIATKRWPHDFCISAIFSTSRPKLLKRPIASYGLGVDLQDCKVWKNSMRTFSKKVRLNFFPVKKLQITLFSIVSSVPVLSWQTETMFSPYVIAVAYSYFSWSFYPVCFPRFQMTSSEVMSQICSFYTEKQRLCYGRFYSKTSRWIFF